LLDSSHANNAGPTEIVDHIADVDIISDIVGAFHTDQPDLRRYVRVSCGRQ